MLVLSSVSSVVRSKPSPVQSVEGSWSREAGADWEARFGEGSAHFGRIGAGLKRIVTAHGWAVVRPVWQEYLADKDPEFASAQDFSAKFAAWQDGADPVDASARKATREFPDQAGLLKSVLNHPLFNRKPRLT